MLRLTLKISGLSRRHNQRHARHAFSEKIDSLSRIQDNDAVFPQILTLFQKTRQNYEDKQTFEFDGEKSNLREKTRQNAENKETLDLTAKNQIE